MAKANLTAERLRELLNYDPDTGVFTWRVRMGRGRPGTVAGCVASKGYWRIIIDHSIYWAHRLAWFYVHGTWPAHDIDHLNGSRVDNRISNLRDVPRRVNAENKRAALLHSHTGVLGVSKDGKPNADGSQRYRARIQAGDKVHYFHGFKTLEEAHQAYLAAKRRLHEGCTI